TLFYSQTKAALNLEVIAKSIPVLAEIQNKMDQNLIDAPLGTMMKNQITASLATLVEAKAVLPSFEVVQGVPAVKQLFGSSPKLLVEGEQGGGTQDEDSKKA